MCDITPFRLFAFHHLPLVYGGWLGFTDANGTGNRWLSTYGVFVLSHSGTFRAFRLFFATATPEARQNLHALHIELERLAPSNGPVAVTYGP